MNTHSKIRTFTTALAVIALAGVAALINVSNANAQRPPSLTITSGVNGGGYFRWAKEAAALCSDVVTLQVLEASGGPENLTRLESNEANMGLMQMDTLLLNGQARTISGIAVLVPLFPEAVHFIARSDLSISSGGYGIGNFKMGKDTRPVNFVNELAGMTVGAAGGAQDTAQYLANTLKYNVFRQDGSGKDVVKGVLANKYQVGILTGAFPIDWLKNMTPAEKAQLKFLSIPQGGIPGLNAYRTGALSYSGFNNRGTVSTPTFMVSSVLMTQDYKKGAKAQAAANFRQCLFDRAEDQAQETGSHPAWRNIKAGATVDNWKMWEGPQAQVTAAPEQVPAWPTTNKAAKK